jgi:SAM-dependent methyltransferase
VSEVAAANVETRDAWSGPLFERFVRFRPFISGGLNGHAEVALATHPPRPGDRVLDVGCGYGDTTRPLAAMVGDGGEVVGYDVSEPFLDLAREEAAAQGIGNVDYRFGDVQIVDLDGPYDYVFSRMGVMFFANPVQALGNVREAMRPGARACFVVWRRKLDNGWTWEAEKVVDKYLEHPDESDEPTCGPGPFSMADADTVTEQLRIAGFGSIELLRSDVPMRMGDTLEQAVDLSMGIGPAAELLRLWGDRAEEIHPKIRAEITAVLAPFDTGSGVIAPASTWIVSAIA